MSKTIYNRLFSKRGGRGGGRRTISRTPVHSLVIDRVFLAITYDRPIESIALVPTVLDNVGLSASLCLQGLEGFDVIGIAHSDETHDSIVLQPFEHLPGFECAPHRIEGRVE